MRDFLCVVRDNDAVADPDNGIRQYFVSLGEFRDVLAVKTSDAVECFSG